MWGRGFPFARLAAIEPWDDECGTDWFDDREAGRLGRVARRLWTPVLAAEAHS